MFHKYHVTHRPRFLCGQIMFPLLGALTLTACTPPAPVTPSFTVLPRPDETFAAFQKNNAQCRLYAQTQTGATPSQNTASNGLKSVVLGTGIGSASGALLGGITGNAGHGAAIGAGSGLMLGSIIGVGRAKQASQTLQQRYDGAYAQCMVGHGERLPPLPMTCGTLPVVAYPSPAMIYPAPVCP